jgi:hypothetical protein
VPKINSFSSYHTKGVAEAILADIDYFSKPLVKFLSTIFAQWWGVVGKYNFTNLSRYVNYNEKALRNGFARGADFLEITSRLVKSKCSDEMILAFDPSYIPKSGKKTEGLGYYWSGVAQSMKKGLELGCLAAIDIKNATGFHLEAILTPGADQRKKTKTNLVAHYRNFVMARIKKLNTISKYLVVDGYFMKKEFILPFLDHQMQVITKMRSDANLQYIYKGVQKEGRGRKLKYAGKVNLKNIDKRKWQKEYENRNEAGYSALLYCVMLKRVCKIVYCLDKKTGKYDILLSTDIQLDTKKIMRYYRLRFQIEFLFRDAKQYAGLADCQARDMKKLNFHFNACLTNVSIAKAQYYLSIPLKERESFSLQNIKRMQHSKLLTDLIFSNLELDMKCKKIKSLYQQCLNFGQIAA